MRFALAEAYKASRAVRPNPRVGCALETVKGELVVGHHEKCGEAHAERRVLDICAERGLDTRGARIAITLEPCSHQGRTPPCADALIQAGVSEVIVGTEDPFPKVQGQGLGRLRAAGVRCSVGVLSDKAEALNREWLFAQRRGRSFLTLKMATSWDGGWRSDRGVSQWITSEEARFKAQQLRRRVDAIVTSQATLRADNPRFTARTPEGADASDQPQVFVLSRSSNHFDLSGFALAKHPRGAELSSFVSPDLFLQDTYARGFHDVMLEAGPGLAQAFLAAGCVDEIWSFVESQFLGGGETLRFATPFAGGALPGLRFVIRELETLGPTSFVAVLGPQEGNDS
jgi:diaminohydroxyphosphoribosylaminopyrimidine deaminase / 5-amino-6-(5-phosphoribosylamino)uracil reductase